MTFYILGAACSYMITILCWIIAFKSRDYFIGFMLLICSFPCISAGAQMHREAFKLKLKEQIQFQQNLEKQKQLEIDKSQMQVEQAETA
jgi:hypothetical protein